MAVADALAMGKKAGDPEQAGHLPDTSTSSNGSALRRCAAQVGAALSAKCVVALVLGVVVFLSAFFMLLHLRSPGNCLPDDPGTLIGNLRRQFSATSSHACLPQLHVFDRKHVMNLDSEKREPPSAINHSQQSATTVSSSYLLTTKHSLLQMKFRLVSSC